VNRRVALRGALALALAAMVLLPAAATARPQPEFSFGAGGGYRIQVSGRGSTVTLSVFRPGGLSPGSLTTLFGGSAKGHSAQTSFGAAYSTYVVRGEASASSIRADFAGFGRIAVHFHPSGRVAHLGSHRGCGGSRFASRHGVFRGEVDFEGEGGYTSAHIHSARGEVVVPLPSRCSGRPSESPRRAALRPEPRAVVPSRVIPRAPKGPKTTFLEALWKSPLGLTAFEALGDGSHSVRYIAAVEQSEGQVAVYRLALAFAPSRSIFADSALSSASVAPPAPFSGQGDYGQADGAKTWTGSLAASFPGAEDFPLTGPQFTVQLDRSW